MTKDEIIAILTESADFIDRTVITWYPPTAQMTGAPLNWPHDATTCLACRKERLRQRLTALAQEVEDA